MAESPPTVLIKKLLFRSWHRGTREMDLIMGRFAEHYLPRADSAALGLYQALLQENDPDIYDWLLGRSAVPAHCQNKVMAALIAFHQASAAPPG